MAMRPSIDHPLLAAERAIESGFLDPAMLERVRDEFNARPRTPAQMRESIFEILGEGFRGCLPIALDAVIDPELMLESMGVAAWGIVGVIDDASVLRLDDGSWLGVVAPDPDCDRDMVLFFVDETSGQSVEAELAEGHEPVWAIPATQVWPMGSERSYRAAMAGGDPSE